MLSAMNTKGLDDLIVLANRKCAQSSERPDVRHQEVSLAMFNTAAQNRCSFKMLSMVGGRMTAE